MIELRWVLYRGDQRVLQWRQCEYIVNRNSIIEKRGLGPWEDVPEIDYQEARRAAEAE